MIRALNILICLCAAAYMFVRLQQGFGCPDVEIPSEYVKNMFDGIIGQMHCEYHFMLCLLGFECLATAGSWLCRRYLKERHPFLNVIRMNAGGFRFAADLLVICAMLLFTALDLYTSYRHNTFRQLRLTDQNGSESVLYTTSKGNNP